MVPGELKQIFELKINYAKHISREIKSRLRHFERKYNCNLKRITNWKLIARGKNKNEMMTK